MISWFWKKNKPIDLDLKEIAASTLYSDAWKRFKKNKVAVTSLIIIFLFVFVAVFAAFIAPYDPYEQDLLHRTMPPSWQHPLGTDNLGRDVLSRIIYGSRISLLVGIVCELIAVPIGVVMGSLAGYYGGMVDMIISRIMEILGSFPFIIFAICIMFIFGGGIFNVFIALGAIGWLGHARQIRAVVLKLKEMEYVEAAKASGASSFRIMFRHLLPNCFSTIIVIATIDIPADIIYEATLSFVGLGINPPEPSWGSMIREATKYVRQSPTYSMFPGLAILFLVLAFSLLGDGLRDALDPKLKNL